MGKASVAVRNAAVAIAAELGVKPSRTVRQMQALAAASAIRDFAPRKGSEGRRPEGVGEDWETPVHGLVTWGYVVQGAPKRVISLPDDNPEYWAAVQGEVLLGHLFASGAKPVGTAYQLRRSGRITRISPVAIIQRYLRIFPSVNRRLTDHLDVRFSGWDKVTVAFWEWDDVAEDVNPTSLEENGSARSLLEFLVEADYKAEEEGRRGRNYR